ncbi:peptidoglycan-binding protein, partial [Kibdelosporangium lantanae]
MTSDAPTATALVEQRKLTAQTILNGTLSYGGKFDIVNRVEGTVTGLPAAGDTIEHGKPLYWIDTRPVVFLTGDLPVYRELATGAKGADVRQLNAELVALGYAEARSLGPGSETFGTATTVAVKKLQKQHGLGQTGKLGLGEVVFLPAGAVRVSKVVAAVGSPAPVGVVEETTSTQRVVTVAVETSQASMIKVGDSVSVTLPDRRTTAGRVKSIGAVATKGDSGSITVDMLIELLKPDEAGGLDQAPVRLG